uniref:hypothetical protein n=1 Tax=Saccharopolyspora galaxeae TaxID=2781241 RepID=UPI00190DCD16
MSFQLAEHATYLEAALWMCHRARWLLEANQSHTALASMSEWGPPAVATSASSRNADSRGTSATPPSSPLPALPGRDGLPGRRWHRGDPEEDHREGRVRTPQHRPMSVSRRKKVGRKVSSLSSSPLP